MSNTSALVARFPDEQSAARDLLVRTVRVLEECGCDYAIVGGWIPFLFHSSPIRHPGTFDVDVLLHESTSPDALDLVSERLVSDGFLFSAKNPFQINRVYDCASRMTVFHVDFLHRHYAERELLASWSRFQSIEAPGSDVVFLDEARFRVRLAPLGLTADESAQGWFASEIGLLATKGRSALSAKRKRDLLDVFLVVSQPRSPVKFLSEARSVYATSGIFQASIANLMDGFSDPVQLESVAGLLASNWPHLEQRSRMERARSMIERTMREFFESIDTGPH